MAAPQTAYQSQALKLKLGTATPLNIFIAKFLQNTTSTSGDTWGDGYFNSTDDDATRKSKILDIFKLDDFITIQNSTVGKSFVGFINPSGDNAPYHNSTRYSRGRVGKDTIGHILLNDAGLNTLGYCETQTNILKYANLVLNNAYFKSAFYINSSAFGLKYRINTGPWVTAPNQDLNSTVDSTLAAKGVYSEPLVFYPTAEKGDNIEVKAYITNAEGIIEGEIISFVADDRIAQVGALYRTDPQDSSNETPVDFWMLAGDFANLNTLTDMGQTTGIYGHTSVFRNTPIASGWYVGILEDKALYVDSNGQFTRYTPLAPATWILSCGVDVVHSDHETFEHGGISFTINFNAPSDILITGYISETPAGQPQVGGFSFSSTMLQGTNYILNTQSEGFIYTGSEYYLIVTTPNHPHMQITGDGQFI